jgi:hypothetical protein
MNLKSNRESNPAVAVFGAAGHTGRFVVSELLRRGIIPIATVRNIAALAGADLSSPQILHRQATVDNEESLDKAIAGAHAVINCAGPFLETADAVARAAIRAGIHYLDLSAEQQSTFIILDKYDRAARKAGIAVVPAMGFFGGFADLLVTAALDDWDHADTIDTMIGLDSWHPTHGTRMTGKTNTTRRQVIAGGQFVPVTLPPVERSWEFTDPLGSQAMVEVPFSEIILIARHVKTAELHTYLNQTALGDVRNPATPAPKAADATRRSAQRFIVDVVATREGMVRRIRAQGRDIYAFSAPLICEVTLRLLEGKFSSAGAQPPATMFDAREILSALTPEYLALEFTRT